MSLRRGAGVGWIGRVVTPMLGAWVRVTRRWEGAGFEPSDPGHEERSSSCPTARRKGGEGRADEREASAWNSSELKRDRIYQSASWTIDCGDCSSSGRVRLLTLRKINK